MHRVVMPFYKFGPKALSAVLAMGLSLSSLFAQQGPDENTALAKHFLQNKEYPKAIPLLKELYEQAPFDKGLYDDLLEAYMAVAAYGPAEALVTYMSKVRKGDPIMYIDMGKVLEASGQKKKALAQYEMALENVPPESFQTKQLADAFVKNGSNDYAIKVYERSRALMQNPYAYGTELALLYHKEGNTEKALQSMLDVLVLQPYELEDTKVSLLQIVEGDPKKMQWVQKQLTARISAQPKEPMWQELMTWLYTQQGDYEGAFKQIVELDKKWDAGGERVMRFAQAAMVDGEYEMALKGFDYAIANSNGQESLKMAKEGRLMALKAMLQQVRPIDVAAVKKLLTEYGLYFDAFGTYGNIPLLRDYALVLARFEHDVDKAIAVLEGAIGAPNIQKESIGLMKLDLGDYYLLNGKVWDASLVYSQVDKAFREDMLGEEARFRNAKLSYYRGDFKWAQGQLAVLKASTTELIANDALYLSVLITENMPADSNLVPLLRFAAADLLLFQHKTRESDALLDSIVAHFPKDELIDDIFMLRARIAMEEGRYTDAVAFLQKIVEEHGDDVLGDDATFLLGHIYDESLKNKEKALYYYEKVITDYPGSTFVQLARARYQKLKDRLPVSSS